MLVHFDPPRICLHDGGSSCLIPLIRSTGIFGPGDRFIVPPYRFRGDRIPRDIGNWARGNSSMLSNNYFFLSNCYMYLARIPIINQASISVNLQATKLFIVTSATKGEGGYHLPLRFSVWYKILHCVI